MMEENLSKKKKIKHICQNCKLYNPEEGVCSVTIVLEGEKYEITTEPKDSCHWEKHGLLNEVRQMRIWSDGRDGFIETT